MSVCLLMSFILSPVVLGGSCSELEGGGNTACVPPSALCLFLISLAMNPSGLTWLRQTLSISSQMLLVQCLNMQMVVQGTPCHLGYFADPVSAAMCYDREAARAHGAAAVLNFPPSAGTVGQPPVLEESGEDEPSALPRGLQPAGKANGNTVLYSGSEVRHFKSYGFIHVLCRVCAASTLSAYCMSMFGAF